ncbi:chemokine-like receptor 1 [Pygocentrus nattereri]|uniref:chemokine-like receptor 1 n=1 Tax=Pygocentrus nattereri TaxID=42514 RepID=UPI001891060F|nr:chemokine-like receptor 1 [Pygocentrus nattereri]
MNSNPESDYDYDYFTPTPSTTPATCTDALCVFLAIATAVIFFLGVAGNGLVIWMAGFKMKKSVNTTWYLSLAVSDFLFCSFLPISVAHLVKNDWVFGLFMCKFTSFILFLNMFSSVFLLVIISVDRCVVVMFPVWAQNKRTIRKAAAVVMLAWIIAAAFSSPSAVFRNIDIHYDIHKERNVCYNNYTSDQQHAAVVSCRFVFGFLIPYLIIIFCYIVIIQKLKGNQTAKFKKPFKIMTALVGAFFICWLPFHTFALMELNHHKYESILHTGMVIGATFASANSCLNPFLYVFMGKDIKKKCALVTKIENAFEEEDDPTIH